MPSDGKRASVRCRDDDYLASFPLLDLGGCRGLHLGGDQADAALYYAKRCRAIKMLSSLDGGGLRSNTHELLSYIDVAVVAERFCEQMRLTPSETLDYLRARGCRIGGVTWGERGLFWYYETNTVRLLTALPVPMQRIIDTSGAGDVFHGA
jgi:sugar/nucleoside kinase (ribokinase family)